MSSTHRNSRIAYCVSDFSRRCQAIIGVLRRSTAPLTDREIMYRLGFTDPNKVRPRCTELVKSGVIRECGNVTDKESGLPVRTVGIAVALQETI